MNATATPASGKNGAPQATAIAETEGSTDWTGVQFLSCHVRAEIDVPRFTVRDLFCLEAGSIVDSGWLQSSDVPLKANTQLIGWAEFEVISDQLAVRVTELY
jgi:flagellar motor switch/type III secretory pathway protein FliN